MPKGADRGTRQPPQAAEYGSGRWPEPSRNGSRNQIGSPALLLSDPQATGATRVVLLDVSPRGAGKFQVLTS